MKKSEMGKHIQHFLENYNKELGLFGRKNEQAFELLELLESLGMLPPSINLNEGSHEFGISGYYVNEWDEE